MNVRVIVLTPRSGQLWSECEGLLMTPLVFSSRRISPTAHANKLLDEVIAFRGREVGREEKRGKETEVGVAKYGS